MTRKVALVVAAILLPGGFVALLGAWLLRSLSQTGRGRQIVESARRRVPAWATAWTAPERQAA